MDSQTSATLAVGREGGHSGSAASMFQGGEDAAILQNGSGAAGIGPVHHFPVDREIAGR